MTGLFDFLKDVPPYCDAPVMRHRLVRRHDLIVAPFQSQIKGARVLDLGCHDGRWSYALAQAGAAHVWGIDARQETLDRFDAFPLDQVKARVTLKCADVFAALESFLVEKQSFDVVAVYGIFYHIMDHARLLRLIAQLGARLVIIDSEFITRPNAIIQLLEEEAQAPLHGVAECPAQSRVVVGVPSQRALEMMAKHQGFSVDWIDPAVILEGTHKGVQDYFRTGRKRRGVCALTQQA